MAEDRYSIWKRYIEEKLADFLPDILLDSEDVADGPILIFEPHVDNASAIGDPVKGRQHLYTASAALPFLTALLTSGGYIFPKLI